jgi:hypothetical protein
MWQEGWNIEWINVCPRRHRVVADARLPVIMKFMKTPITSGGYFRTHGYEGGETLIAQSDTSSAADGNQNAR